MGSTMALKNILFLYLLCFTFHTDSYGIEIEGLIDLGPKWNYEYKFSPISYPDSTVKTNHLTKFFGISQVLRTDKDFENEKQQKLRIKELRHTMSPLEDHSSDKYNITNSREHKFDEILDSETSKENDDIKRLKLIVGSTGTKNRNSKLEYHSTQFMFHDQLKDENYSKVSKTKMKNNLRVTLDFQSTEKKHAQKSHKNEKRYRFPNNITSGDHKVKEVPKIFDFILHIFKQNLKIFDNLMKTAQLDKIKQKVKSVKKRYIGEFKNFLSINKDYKIKTKLGNQKIIFNTIDTSNNILQRLVHQLSKSEDHNNFVMNNLVKIFQRDVDRQKLIEGIHACKKFGVCRKKVEYSDFIAEIIGIIIQASDSKVKQASDAFTEVVKTTDFSNVLYNNIQNEIRKLVENVEVLDPFLLRPMFLVLKMALSNKNHPIVIMDPVDEELAAKTTAFHNLIDILDKNIGESANSTEWDEIKRQFEEWKDGSRSDILNLFQTLIKQIEMVFDKMDSKTAQQVNENMKIILKPSNKSDKSARMGTQNPYYLEVL